MSEMKFTLSGFESFLNNNDSSLFDDIQLPQNCPADLVRAVMLERAGEFETLYADPYQMRFATKVFFLKHQRTFEQWFMGINLDYEPLWNFDRHEEWTENFEGEKNGTASGSNGNTRTFDTNNFDSKTTRGTDTNTKTLDTETESRTVYDTTEGRTEDLSMTRNMTTTDTGTLKTERDDINTGSATTTNTKIVDQDETSSGTGQTINTVAAFNTSTAQAPYNPNEKDDTSNSGSRALDETTTVNGSDSSRNVLDGETLETHNLSSNVSGIESGDNSITTTKDGTDTVTTEDTGSITDELVHNTTEETNATQGGTITDAGSSSNTDNETDEHEITHTGHLYGNIGVTTSSALLKEFLDISAWNFFEHVSDLYCEELLITVY